MYYKYSILDPAPLMPRICHVQYNPSNAVRSWMFICKWETVLVLDGLTRKCFLSHKINSDILFECWIPHCSCSRQCVPLFSTVIHNIGHCHSIFWGQRPSIATGQSVGQQIIKADRWKVSVRPEIVFALLLIFFFNSHLASLSPHANFCRSS